MKYFWFTAALLGVWLTADLWAAPVPGTPRDSNTNNTGGYDSTRVETQLIVTVKDDTKTLHFVRDNNDPRVITKTYVLKNVDAYEFRDYLRQMVQTKRVGNTALQQVQPGNTAEPVAAAVSSPELAPTQAQPGYNPAAQLGSNTAVECLKYSDGTGLLIVSAEEYRFKDQKGGMGIDSIVAMFDNPSNGALNFGSQMFIYMPKFVPARNLQPLIQNLGMNISDVTELWQGQDLVAYDATLNWLIFDVENYSCDNIADMLAKFDVPIPQVRMKITVYELYDENDEKMGLDFQNWKNNDGVNFFSGGGRFRNNWAAAYGGGLGQSFGSERTGYFNFNPKWNTRYIDFLTAIGKAKVLHSGELLLRNDTRDAVFARTSKLFYIDASQPAQGSLPAGNNGVGPFQYLADIIAKTLVQNDDIPVGKGNQQVTTVSNTDFGFTMTIHHTSVNLEETRFTMTLNNTSLIGFQSDGTPRIAPGSTIKLNVSLPHGSKDSFVIGGLQKQEEVISKTGIPWLCDIPYLGYLFGTEAKSIKNSRLVVMAKCEWDAPPENSFPARSKSYDRGRKIAPEKL